MDLVEGVHAVTVAGGEEVNGVQEAHKLIIGVDFGTTYSGVAVVHTAQPDDIDIIRNWPGGNSLTSDKVPTEISYDPPPPARNSRVVQETNTAFNNDVRWGFQFKPDEPRLRCLKLFLDRNQTLPSFVSSIETAAQLKRHDKTVLDAASDYLRKLNEHTIQTLNRRYGDNFVATTEIQYVLTVPAVWSDAAKMATLTAAEMAGMGSRQDIRMISEPEAAALYTLTTAQSAGLKVGDNFVVCDAGGGTVDLIAYKAKSLSPLRVEETAVGTGGLCGSAFLNYRFEDHVRQRIGKETYEMMREKKPKTWMMGLRFFEENVKRNFDPTDARAEEVNVPFPGLPDDEEAGLDSGFLSMSAEQVKDIFDPVIDEIIALLQGQIDSIRERGEIVSGIILVGGFGSSDYLYKRMKEHFGGALTSDGEEAAVLDASSETNGDAKPAIEVMQPLYAWTAVVRGAVLSGMEGDMVERRRSRRHYGTTYATVYDETKHTEKERYWSPMWERWMVSNRMQWHIAKVSQSVYPSRQPWLSWLSWLLCITSCKRCDQYLTICRTHRLRLTRRSSFITLEISVPDNRWSSKTKSSHVTRKMRRRSSARVYTQSAHSGQTSAMCRNACSRGL